MKEWSQWHFQLTFCHCASPILDFELIGHFFYKTNKVYLGLDYDYFGIQTSQVHSRCINVLNQVILYPPQISQKPHNEFFVTMGPRGPSNSSEASSLIFFCVCELSSISALHCRLIKLKFFNLKSEVLLTHFTMFAGQFTGQ